MDMEVLGSQEMPDIETLADALLAWGGKWGLQKEVDFRTGIELISPGLGKLLGDGGLGDG